MSTVNLGATITKSNLNSDSFTVYTDEQDIYINHTIFNMGAEYVVKVPYTVRLYLTFKKSDLLASKGFGLYSIAVEYKSRSSDIYDIKLDTTGQGTDIFTVIFTGIISGYTEWVTVESDFKNTYRHVDSTMFWSTVGPAKISHIFPADLGLESVKSTSTNKLNIELNIQDLWFRLKRSRDDLESVDPSKLYDDNVSGSGAEITSFKISFTYDPETAYTVTFHGATGGVIGKISSKPGSHDLNVLAVNAGVTPPIKKSDSTTDGTKYTVNFYLDKDSSTTTGKSQSITGGASTTTYTHEYVAVSSGNHYLWKIDNKGAGIYELNLTKSVDVYPSYSTVTSGGDPPTTLPTSGFYIATKRGYRSSSGKRENNTYYDKNGRQVSPGGPLSSDMIDGKNINLHLEWTPANYTIIFNKGDGEWLSSSNILTSITKEFGKEIPLDTTGYPDHNARLTKTGYLQYGWITTTSSVHKSGDKSLCTYKYSEAVDGPGYDSYKFTRNKIDDTWFDDNYDTVNVYPCWVLINHKLISNYYISKNVAVKQSVKNFNIETPISIASPVTGNKAGGTDGKGDTWNFLGWAQGDPPEGDNWKWGTGGTELKNYGVFKNLEELKNVPYSYSYGINKGSLTDDSWSDPSFNINLYCLWSLISKYVYINKLWRPVTGVWVYRDNEWHWANNIDVYKAGSGWKSEIND